MDPPAVGIAGRTRSRSVYLSPTSAAGSTERRPHRIRILGGEIVVPDGEEGGGRQRDGVQERRDASAADEGRHPMEKHPVAGRTRSKTSSVINVTSMSQLPSLGRSATRRSPHLEDDDMVEIRGERTTTAIEARTTGVEKTKRLASPPASGLSAKVAYFINSEEIRVQEPSSSSVSGRTDNLVSGSGDAGAAETPAKRKFCGIDIVIPNGGFSSKENGGIAKRTRSHFAFASRGQWQRQRGTLRSPYRVDTDSSGPESDTPPTSSFSAPSDHESSEDDDGATSVNLQGSSLQDGDAKVQEDPEERRHSPWGPRRRKRRRDSKKGAPAASGKSDVCRLLIDDIMQNKYHEPISENAQARTLPRVFSFGDEDYGSSGAAEKSDFELALDTLWTEFDFATGVNELGSGCGDQLGEENVAADDDAPSGECSKGNHKLVLDEQVGIVCQICSYVELEIRYVTPSFETRCFSVKPCQKISSGDDGFSELQGSLGDEAADHGTNHGAGVKPRGTIWDLVHPDTKRSLFPHQREGLEFIWRNLAGGILVEKVEKNMAGDGAAGGGCVITHAPGTGKTRLAIVFLQTFLKVFPQRRPVVLAPSGMLLTWTEEFDRCNVGFPFHVLNGVQGPERSKAAVNGGAGAAPGKKVRRLLTLHSWATRGGVLGISYGLFGRLAGERTNKQAGTKHGTIPLSKILLEKPGLFIFDEGHTARNESSSIWKVLQKIRTRCRVILSGTPFQNNLRELENVLCLVRPELSGKVSSSSKPRKPSGGGGRQSAKAILSDDGIEELRSTIRPFVHLHSGTVLGKLPGLRQCLIILNPSGPHQTNLLRGMQRFPRGNFLDYEFKVSMASIHPSLLASARLSAEQESAVGHDLLRSLREEKVISDHREGAKTMFLTEVVRLSASLGEKVLVFSRYREPLSWIRGQLTKVLGWDERKVMQMDGGLPPRQRQSYIDDFNAAGSEVRVLLASIKACCEGINLVGASRVVLLDTVWNPSVERQAISRAYRLGQGRVVFTYHLVTAETGELERYQRQAEKDRISKLVFPSRDGGGGDGDPASVKHGDRILMEMMEHEKLKKMFKQVIFQPKDAMELLDAFDP